MPKIQTHEREKSENGIYHDDSALLVKAKTIDELHSLQKKRSALTTPIKDGAQQGNAAFATISEEERQKLQLQSIRADPARKAEATKVAPEHHHYLTPTISVSDSALKFTHNHKFLVELYEQAIKHEHGSFITSTGALATLSGVKTGRSPRDKRIVKDETTANELWWGNIDLNLDRKEMVILGTQYVGEMKKGLFGVMHYLMPKRNILSLHSSNNMGKDGDVSLFFGLLVLENVVFDEHTREVDYSNNSIIENTRASYPIEYIPNAKIPCVGPHPKNVILLACDAFGMLPLVSKLTFRKQCITSSVVTLLWSGNS
ncbi:hypothetical protein ZIOFF_021920 [Zingiber officinale]|uniref:phosphoenolpyruvate carboxykinase (ATP) n=1 Tax=Zingiber officinale TaxID=94328 RepID=A0A8J5H8V2_ZINOF|nr:hypothetical protein ZIOFF_021920 [Zingiber officinale]